MLRKAKLTDADAAEALLRLVTTKRRAIDAILQDAWDEQASELDADAFAAAASARAIPAAWDRIFRDSYNEAGAEDFAPIWTESQRTAAGFVIDGAAELGIDFGFETLDGTIEGWSANRAAAWSATMVDTQKRAFEEVIARGEELVERDLAFHLELATGITPAEARQLIRLRAALLEDAPDTPRSTLEKTLLRQRDRIMKERKKRVARLELAESFNAGAVAAAQDLERNGDLAGVVVKVWNAQADERICPICGPLDGQSVTLSAVFTGDTLSSPKDHPPAHLGCRCVVTFDVEL